MSRDPVLNEPHTICHAMDYHAMLHARPGVFNVVQGKDPLDMEQGPPIQNVSSRAI